jgi:hypothetical protein
VEIQSITSKQERFSMDDSPSELIQQILASNHAEAREWLRGSSRTEGRNLGKLDLEELKEFVERIYALGAERVLVVEIEEDEGYANTKHLLVKLPEEDDVREAIFAFECEHAAERGFDATPDEGQEYLYFNAK